MSSSIKGREKASRNEKALEDPNASKAFCVARRMNYFKPGLSLSKPKAMLRHPARLDADWLGTYLTDDGGGSGRFNQELLFS
jgi:hypothetical protein